MKKDEELLKLKNDLPLNPGSPRDRYKQPIDQSTNKSIDQSSEQLID